MANFNKPLLALTVAVAGVAGTANAASVSCPGARVFEVTTTLDSTCLATGVGNLSGNSTGSNPDPFLSSTEGTGYVLIDKSDDTDPTEHPNPTGLDPDAFTGSDPLTTGLSGSFSFSIDPLLSFSSIAIAFKSGQGQLDPDWAVFLLPAGITSGTWSISGQQALSHANLYGIVGANGTNGTVPLPATGLLLLGALGGFGIARRKRKKA